LKEVLVLFAEGSEELETVTIVNILRRGGLLVTLAGLTPGAIRGCRGITLHPDQTLEAALNLNFDMIVLPGGQPGTNHLKADYRVLTLLKKMVAHDKFVAAICAAPTILASIGLLDGKQATCFPSALNQYSSVKIQECAVIEDGKIITSRGPGTAMEFALLLVERLSGAEKRIEVEMGLVR
jgi:4-methyl-5(b-hydroxyethyl)-thiazole monophosphate biosynthesis